MHSKKEPSMIEYVKNQFASQKRYHSTFKKCRIVSLSPQGDLVFAIARYPDSQSIINNKTVLIKGSFVGNEHEAPESDLLLSEILINTDLNFKIHKGLDLKKIIGLEAEVELIDTVPVLIHILKDQFNSRLIDRNSIIEARTLDPEKKITEKNLSLKGIEKTTSKLLLKEKVSDIKPEGFILVNGDLADWSRESLDTTKRDKSFKDISSYSDPKVGVGYLPFKLQKKICYSAPTLFTGY